jgi:hypothetical protein
MLYEYAYCDSEAWIQATPTEFKTTKMKIYSLAVLPVHMKNETRLDILLSDWNIDGHTRRRN